MVHSLGRRTGCPRWLVRARPCRLDWEDPVGRGVEHERGHVDLRGVSAEVGFHVVTQGRGSRRWSRSRGRTWTRLTTDPGAVAADISVIMFTDGEQG